MPLYVLVSSCIPAHVWEPPAIHSSIYILRQGCSGGDGWMWRASLVSIHSDPNPCGWGMNPTPSPLAWLHHGTLPHFLLPKHVGWQWSVHCKLSETTCGLVSRPENVKQNWFSDRHIKMYTLPILVWMAAKYMNNTGATHINKGV